MSYSDWFDKIVWLKDKVILPNNNRISKINYQTEKGFDTHGFNSMLFKEYNKQEPVKPDGRRYKK